MLNLPEIVNPQYSAVTGLRRKVSPASLLLAQLPAYRGLVQSNKANAFEEKKLAEDTRQADVSLAQTAQQFDTSQALTKDIAAKNEALQAQQMEASKEQAQQSNRIQSAGLTLTGAYLADKTGFSLRDLATSKTAPTVAQGITGTAGSTVAEKMTEAGAQTALAQGVGTQATQQAGLNASGDMAAAGWASGGSGAVAQRASEEATKEVAKKGVTAGTGVSASTSLFAAGAGIATQFATNAIMDALNIGGEEDQRRVSAAAGGAVSGAIVGAQIGSVGGPWGAVIGGGVGLVVSEIFCFVAGTPVLMADKSTVPVEDVRIGDCLYAGDDVLGVGVVLAGNICRYKGVQVEGGHAVFEDGRWLRVKNSSHAEPVPADQPVRVYPVITQNHLICVNGIIFADLCETDQGPSVSDDDRLACLNSMTMRNAMLEDLEHEISEI